MLKALLTAIALVGLAFPAAGACLQRGGVEYAMPCCSAGSCSMGEAMRGGSCCAKIQGESGKVSIAHPAPGSSLAAEPSAVRLTVAEAISCGIKASDWQHRLILPSAPPHPLQI
jgi:hypothetical protein